MKRITTPRTRAEFERNLNLLHRHIKDGKLHVAQGLSQVIEGILRLRFLPNGRMDFLSVDESARLEANMITNMMDGLFEEQMTEYQSPPNQSSPESVEESLPLDSDGKFD